MKYLSASLLILAFGTIPVFSQKTSRQPPAPLIYQAPGKNELKEFTSAEMNFSAVFPGVPKVEKRDMGQAQVSIFSVARPGSATTVTVFEFKSDLEDSRERTFELFKTSLINSTKLKMEAERDLQFAGNAAKEFDFSEEIKFYKIRILVSGKRIYELKTDVTNWHILTKYNQARVADFENEKERFFESFKFLEIPKKEPVPLNFLGIVNETGYVNKFFGFSLEFPENWEVDDPLASEAEINAGIEALKINQEKFDRMLAEAAKMEVIIFGASSGKSEALNCENFLVGVLKLPDPEIDPAALLKNTGDFFVKNPKIKIFEEIKTIEINGVRFASMTLETTIEDIKIKQTLYLTVRKGYSINFTMSYFDDDQRNSLEKIFESVRFDK